MKKFLIGSFCLLPLFLFSQEVINNTYFLKEYFQDNNSGWNLGKGKAFKKKLNKEGLSLQSTDPNGELITFIEINLDQNSDYLIKTSIKKMSGDDSRSYGLLWGQVDSLNCYSFEITNKGLYSIGEYAGDEYTSFVDRAESPYLEPDIGNVLSVYKIGDRTYFYISNEALGIDYELKDLVVFSLVLLSMVTLRQK